MAMAEPDPPRSPAPPQLHFTLQRHPEGWQADLQAEGVLQHFDSLPALIAWLSRLETPRSVGGIR
jgi:hypothetical protein